MDNHRRPRILLGITGSVAAVKGPRLALRLANEVRADVKVVLSRTVEQNFWKEGKAVASYDDESWREFLAATSAISEEGKADGDNYEDWRSSKGSISIHYAEEEWANYHSLQDRVLHIDLRNWADLCLIAPLSAHTLAKIANGLCDDLLTCCMRAWNYGQRKPTNGGDVSGLGKPVILAPAMNTAMWDHPLTRIQLETIQQFTSGVNNIQCEASKRRNGVIIVEPAVKTLACGEVGAGALAELDDIICAVKECLVGWDTNGCSATVNANNDTAKQSSDDKRESMKRALLIYAKQRFSEMKSSHEHEATEPNSSRLVAPISPTPGLIIESFLPRLNLTPNSLLIDLGCGDGRWLIAANERTQCKCVGIDVDEERLKIAKESILQNRVQEQVQVIQRDVFGFVKESDEICRADVIIVYLFREAMMEIGTLLHQRLRAANEKNDKIKRKRVQILSVGFALVGWKPVYKEKMNGIRVYLYSTEQIPLTLRGIANEKNNQAITRASTNAPLLDPVIVNV